VSFYEALRKRNIVQILNQTNIETIFITENHIQKLIEMKDDQGIGKLKNLVIIGELSIKYKNLSLEAGFQVYRYDEIIYEGKTNPKPNKKLT